jgi:CelD/BcsL family acetyltransferase involved in cellulose biosynthesis
LRVVHNVSEAEWWKWIEEVGDANFFQTPLWAQVLVDAFPDFRVETRLYEQPDGSRVLVPLMRRPKLRGALATLESMPFGTYGAFLGERAQTREEVRAILADMRRSRTPVARLMITPNPLTRFAIPEDSFHCQNFVHFLRLEEGYDQIWRSRFSRGLRYSVRKSLRRGVKVEMERGEKIYNDFCHLYRETARPWERKPPFDEPFFACLARLEERHVQLWVARHEGKMIAGCVIFTYGEHQIPYVGGFDRDYRGYDPNNLMYAEAMKWGARTGFRYFNFLSSAGIKGVEHFKSSFGTQRLFFNFYLYENPLVRLLRAPLSAIRSGAA